MNIKINWTVSWRPVPGWAVSQSFSARSLLNLMTSAFFHFKASGVPLTVNLQPWLVATGVYPRNLQWPTRSLYGPRGGTAGLHGRPERQFHLWHLFSLRRGRTPSLTDIPWISMDGTPLARPPSFLLRPSPPPIPRPGGVLIWQRAGMGPVLRFVNGGGRV